jgi:uncharacterized protein (UPF0332 family)
VVEISFQYRKRPVDYHFDEVDLQLTQTLATKLKEELKDLLKSVILFGSAARGAKQQGSDIDVLLIVNDVSLILSKEVIVSLRVIIENCAAGVSNNFHITTMQLSQFWDYLRNGDPIVVNMIREGRAVMDEGFFAPIQGLLDQGRIRPSKEAVWAYYLRAPQTIQRAERRLLDIVVDLYWAVIDAAHAALMHIDVVPGAPHHVAHLLEDHFVRKRLLEKKYVDILKNLYTLSKEVGHHQLVKMSGKDVDVLIGQAQEFVDKIKFILNHDPKKLTE